MLDARRATNQQSRWINMYLHQAIHNYDAFDIQNRKFDSQLIVLPVDVDYKLYCESIEHLPGKKQIKKREYLMNKIHKSINKFIASLLDRCGLSCIRGNNESVNHVAIDRNILA